MLPENWSEPPGPSTAEWLEMPARWSELVERYMRELDGGMALKGALEVVAQAGLTNVLVERSYIDRDFRDEFANFYAQTFPAVPDRCQRLHFFDDSTPRYLGFSVLRPILGRPVCRTVLAPPPGLARHIACLARSQASPYGFRFSVEGFPFISQDYQYGVCAHAAIWMVAHYFHLRFRGPRYHMSDIVQAASSHPEIYRSTPSRGLTHRQISAVLQEFDMPAISYVLDDQYGPVGLSNDETLETVACRYLNSGLPVILLHDDHARVLIGYGREDKKDGKLLFICHDDVRGPYDVIDTPAGDTINGTFPVPRRLVVPLPGRIYLAGEAAEEAGHTFFATELASRPELDEQRRAWDEGRLRLRTHVREIADYRHALRSRSLPPGAIDLLARMPASHWVWVVELQDRAAAEAGRECVIGELVVDGTSDDLNPNYLFAYLPGVVQHWPVRGGPGKALDVEAVDGFVASGAVFHV